MSAIQPSVLVRKKADRRYSRTLPSMQLRIAEREGDHASSQDIVDLIGRTGACVRVRARDNAPGYWVFGACFRKECAADSPFFWADNACRDGGAPNGSDCQQTSKKMPEETRMSTPKTPPSTKTPQLVLTATTLAMLALTGASVPSRSAPLYPLVSNSTEGSVAAAVIIPVRAVVRGGSVRVGPRGSAVVRGGGLVGPRGGAAVRRTAVVGPRGNVVVAGGGRRWTRPFWYRWPA